MAFPASLIPHLRNDFNRVPDWARVCRPAAHWFFPSRNHHCYSHTGCERCDANEHVFDGRPPWTPRRKRAIAQMLCQSKLEELLADPTQILPIENDVFLQYPGWAYSVTLEPTAIDKFVRLTVSVSHIPGTEIGANLDLATTASEPTDATVPADQLPERPHFQDCSMARI